MNIIVPTLYSSSGVSISPLLPDGKPRRVSLNHGLDPPLPRFSLTPYIDDLCLPAGS